MKLPFSFGVYRKISCRWREKLSLKIRKAGQVTARLSFYSLSFSLKCSLICNSSVSKEPDFLSAMMSRWSEFLYQESLELSFSSFGYQKKSCCQAKKIWRKTQNGKIYTAIFFYRRTFNAKSAWPAAPFPDWRRLSKDRARENEKYGKFFLIGK